jgi:hypothetical protein
MGQIGEFEEEVDVPEPLTVPQEEPATPEPERIPA